MFRRTFLKLAGAVFVAATAAYDPFTAAATRIVHGKKQVEIILMTDPDVNWKNPDGNIALHPARKGKWQAYAVDSDGKNERLLGEFSTDNPFDQELVKRAQTALSLGWEPRLA